MKRWLKIAAVLAVALDFLTPGAGFIGGAFDLAAPQARAAGIPANAFISQPANPTALSTLTTAKMLGIGVNGGFVPRYDGVALVTITGQITTSLVSSTVTLQMFSGTGAPPANAGSVAGSACGNGVAYTQGATAGYNVPFSITCIVTGMALTQGYWFDVAASSSGSATVTATGLTVNAVEQ